MNRQRARIVGFVALGLPLAVGALVTLLWPGPLALDDRIPLALLFGIPAVIVVDVLQRELE